MLSFAVHSPACKSKIDQVLSSASGTNAFYEYYLLPIHHCYYFLFTGSSLTNLAFLMHHVFCPQVTKFWLGFFLFCSIFCSSHHNVSLSRNQKPKMITKHPSILWSCICQGHMRCRGLLASCKSVYGALKFLWIVNLSTNSQMDELVCCIRLSVN